MHKTDFLVSLAKEVLDKSTTATSIKNNREEGEGRVRSRFSGLVSRVKAADALADYGNCQNHHHFKSQTINNIDTFRPLRNVAFKTHHN